MKLTSFQIYHLKGIAKQLPIVLTDTHEKHLVRGKDILEWGTISEVDGKPIDPDKQYMWHYPVQMYRNHYRRLKKAYQKDEMNGVVAYLKEINDIIQQSENSKALGAFVALQQFLNIQSHVQMA